MVYPFLVPEDINSEKFLIYGASIGGEIILHLLRERNIPVWGICDRAKCGQEFCGFTVMRPEEAMEEENLSVLVAATRSFNSIIQFLDSYRNVKIYEFSDFLQNSIVSCEEISYDDIAVEDYKKKYKYYVNEYQNDGKIILPTFDLVVTEVCTMKCRDCSALVPYLPERKTYCAEKIIEDIKKLSNVVDHIIEFVIVGGEPFVYKELDKILYFLDSQDFIDEISVVSNGTVLPSENLLDALKLRKVRVRISDYDMEIQKIDQLISLFERNSINYYIQKLEFWLDMGKPVKRDYSPTELAELFRDCAFSRSQGLLDGKIFRCMHAAEIYNLNRTAIQEKEDYIEIRENKEDYNELKKSLKRYLFDIDAISLCDYCSGAKSNTRGIKPAIQV